VVVVINGVTLVSPDAVPADKCDALKRYNPTMMCIEKEPDCGTVRGLKRCPDYPVTKRYARKR
jgi:hypothetical protein